MDKRNATIKFQASSGARLPTRGTEGAAGWDLYTYEDCDLKPYEAKVLRTGLKVAIPEGFVLYIMSRSGFSIKNQIIMPNGVGVIDEDYRGELGLSVMWAPDPSESHQAGSGVGPAGRSLYPYEGFTFHILAHTRIAQCILSPYYTQDWSPCNELPPTRRGEGGFGHTGLRADDAKPDGRP